MKRRCAGVISNLFLMIASVMVTILIGLGMTSVKALEGDYEEGDWSYRVFDDGTAEIIAYKGNAIDVVIPNNLGGIYGNPIWWWYFLEQ